MREPPTFENLVPAALTGHELTRHHEALASWIDDALAALPCEAPPEDLFDTVHAKLSSVASERAARQREDREGRPLR